MMSPLDAEISKKKKLNALQLHAMEQKKNEG